MRDLRSPIRRAYEERDYDALLAGIRADCTVNAGGCWIWQRKKRQGRKDGTPYPEVRIAGKEYRVHRLALEAALRRPLGREAAHHRCAETLCCNPDHLQPVTLAENNAEMLARRAFLARIEELEHALREVAPGHPALRVT